MKTIGIIGGITWLSTAEYYRLLNEMVNKELGGVHSARIVLHSVDFEEIKTLTFANDWQGISEIMCATAKKLEQAGAACVLLAANTMHNIAGDIQETISIPLLHIADVTGTVIRERKMQTVALLGTKYTMEMGFYQERLAKYNIDTILPDAEQREYIHNAIYTEMSKNIFKQTTKNRMLAIINELANNGAQGIVLGCTEIPLLIKQTDCAIPVFDTTHIHAAAAVSFALK